jgi:hypothetical protein
MLGATKAPDAHVPSGGQASQPSQLDAGNVLSTGSPTSALGSDATSPASMPTVMAPEAGLPPDAALMGSGPSVSPDAAVTAPPDRCDAVGRYGVKLALDVTWEATSGSIASGRGRADLYALLNVEGVDPQTHAVAASGRVCGLALPVMETMGQCGSYQFRFDDALWEEPTLPQMQLSGTYACDTNGCNLRLNPMSYVLGLHLDDPLAPLPDAGVSTGVQFPDDDRDGQPGVTVDVVTQASTSMSSGCGYPAAWTQDAGTGMNQDQAATWRLVIGARTQLMAALELGADCRIDRASGAVESLDLRAAGCGFQPGSDPNAPGSTCAEEWRGAIDQSMPQYHVLGAGQTPTASMPISMRDMTPSQGTLVQAIRLDPAAMVGCRELRATMF